MSGLFFEHYLIYKNLSQVSAICRQRGYREKRGKIPAPESIRKILTTPQYCGQIYKGNHKPIIDVDIFNKAQVLLKKQGKITG